MDSTVEELVITIVFIAGMASLSLMAVMVCFFHRAKQVPSATMATSCNTASSNEAGSEPHGKEELIKTEAGIPHNGDPQVNIPFKCRSSSSQSSLVLVTVSPLDLTPLMPKQPPHLSRLSSTPPSHVATMSLCLSPLSPITSIPRLSPAGSDSYDDELLLLPLEEKHF